MDVKDIHVLIKVKVYKSLVNSLFVLILFCIDRFSKIYVIELAEKTDITEVYLTSFLNSYLVWNTGIAFGLFSLSNEFTYNLFTSLIVLINLIIIFQDSLEEAKHKKSVGNIMERLMLISRMYGVRWKN